MAKALPWSVDQPIEPFEPIAAEQLPEGNWLYQIKWDGVRMLLYADGDRCELFNRHGNHRTALYPELLDWRSYCSASSSILLDGEIIALGADGKPSFHEVMRRDGIRRTDRVKQAAREVPITYMVFDLLYCDGEWWNNKPLAERTRKLEELLHTSRLVQLVPSYPDGAALLQVTKAQSLEGIVAKQADSTYSFGGKDGRWLKIKHWGDVIATIGGYTTNAGIVNALVAGVFDDKGGFHFIGKVGTGRLKRSEWAALADVFAPIRRSTSPFIAYHRDMAGANWVEPLLTMRVQYAEWRWQEGRQLRQPMIEALLGTTPAPPFFTTT